MSGDEMHGTAEAHADLARDLEMAAALMVEASKLIDSLDPCTRDGLALFRWPLIDELDGAAGILRDRLAQSKAQPKGTALTPEQRHEMWVAATIDLPSPENCYLRGIRDAERAHGIGAAQAPAPVHRDDAAAAELSRTTRTRLQISGWAYNLDKPCITDVERSLQVLHNTWDYCDDITRNGRTFGAAPAFMRAFSDAITVMEDMAQKYADSATPQAAQAYGVVDGAAIDEARRQLLNTPELRDFSEGVTLEALHQRERWGAEHDAGKAPADWFWLVVYLAGKALHAQTSGNTEKALHHTISTAAALANWHAAITGENTAMRPGIDTAVLRVPESNL